MQINRVLSNNIKKFVYPVMEHTVVWINMKISREYLSLSVIIPPYARISVHISDLYTASDSPNVYTNPISSI